MFLYQGFTTPMWSWSNSQAEISSLQKLKATGANSIIMDFHLSTQSVTGSVVDYRNDKTISQLNEALATAVSQGVDVWFKPIVIAGTGPDQNDWQKLSPTDTSLWFSTYKTKLLEIAKVLENNKVSHFVLTNELLSMTTNPNYIPYWLDLIASIREVYHGKLGFNCGALLGPWSNGNEVLSVPQKIFDSLDFIGLSSYPRLQQSSPFTVEGETAGWTNSAYQQNLAKTLSDFVSAQKIPVYFTELGSPAYQNGNYSYGSNFTTDFQSQSNFYTASLAFLSKYFPTEIQGVFVYNWLQSESASMMSNKGTYSPYDWNINGKPAAAAITTEFSKSTPASNFKIYALPFSETITGSDGSDTVVFDSPRNGSTITQAPNQITVKTGSINYTLSAVERITFVDTSIAFDLSQNAGTTAKVLGAVFGKSAVTNKAYVGIGLDLLDKGMSYDTLAGLALSAAKLTSNDQIVTTLWTNVVGSAPSTADKAPFIQMLVDGMSPGALAHIAADTLLNRTNINLTGLSETGIEYFPVA